MAKNNTPVVPVGGALPQLTKATSVFFGKYVGQAASDTGLTDLYLARKPGDARLTYTYTLATKVTPFAPGPDKLGARNTFQAPLIVQGLTVGHAPTERHLECVVQHFMDWKDELKKAVAPSADAEHYAFHFCLDDVDRINAYYRAYLHQLLGFKDTIEYWPFIVGVTNEASPVDNVAVYQGPWHASELPGVTGMLTVKDWEVAGATPPTELVWQGRFDLWCRVLLRCLLEGDAVLKNRTTIDKPAKKYSLLAALMRLQGPQILDSMAYKSFTMMDWDQVSETERVDYLCRLIVFKEFTSRVWQEFASFVNPVKNVSTIFTFPVKLQNLITDSTFMTKYVKAPLALPGSGSNQITWLNMTPQLACSGAPINFCLTSLFPVDNHNKGEAANCRWPDAFKATYKGQEFKSIDVSQFPLLPAPFITGTGAEISGNKLLVDWDISKDAYPVKGTVPAGELEYRRQTYFDPIPNTRVFLMPRNIPIPRFPPNYKGFLNAMTLSQRTVVGGDESYIMAEADFLIDTGRWAWKGE